MCTGVKSLSEEANSSRISRDLRCDPGISRDFMSYTTSLPLALNIYYDEDSFFANLGHIIIAT